MKKIMGFSLVELLVSVIVISLLLALLAPVITKKTKSTHVSLVQNGEITTECSNSSNYGEKCELCTKKYCIKCGLENCNLGKYVNTKKCDCAPCTDWDPQCLTCNSKGCTRCNNSPMRYVKNGKCELCPSGHYCDGSVDYATCPGDGYYCDSAGIHKCSDKYDANCTTCTEQRCQTCNAFYYYNSSSKKCEACSNECASCTSPTNCTQCNFNHYMTSQGNCASCALSIPNCQTCKNENVCTQCFGSHYVNLQKKCSLCEAENCITCKDNQGSSVCSVCKAGFYNTNGICTSCKKYGANCAICDNNKCLSCNQGYYLENNECVSNDNKFNCSDSNFMRVGNLCVTRKNMGDSYALAIPNTVTLAAAGSEFCYPSQAKCCWVGTTTKNCTAENSGYSGCTRTVCDWNSANEICSKFNYMGKHWRLPTTAEMTNWNLYSVGVGSNGLQLCDFYSGLNSDQCYISDLCPGSSNRCHPYAIWAKDSPRNLYANAASMHSGTWYTTDVTNYIYIGFSVRCVTEME